MISTTTITPKPQRLAFRLKDGRVLTGYYDGQCYVPADESHPGYGTSDVDGWLPGVVNDATAARAIAGLFQGAKA